MLKLNETPVRTSRNFKINNIKLENIMLPENAESFENIKIVADESAVIEKDIDMIQKPIYGVGEDAYKNIIDNCNSFLRVSGEKVKLLYDFDDKNLNLINYIEIIANNDMSVIIEYSSCDNCCCFANSIIRAIAKPGVNVDVTFANFLNKSSNCFLSIENEIDEDGCVKYVIADLGARNSIQNFYSNVKGKSGISEINSIYLGDENQLKDINYIVELYGEKTIANIDVQGALSGAAKKNFKGTIDFKKGSKKAKGDENEYCMLLSNKAKSIALPMLLCTEDDVEGNHATASGKLDDKDLFYIMSRGLDKKEATKLIVKGRFSTILDKIEDTDLRDEINQEIDRRLG